MLKLNRLNWKLCVALTFSFIVGMVTDHSFFYRIQKNQKTNNAQAYFSNEGIEAAADQTVARYTKYLALFTAALAGVGITQGIFTAQQIRLAREEFDASHRPFFIIHSVRLLEPESDRGPDDQPLRVRFELINGGDGVAKIEASSVCLEYSYAMDAPWMERTIGNQVIKQTTHKVGASTTIHVESGWDAGAIHWADEDLWPGDRDRKNLYFYGWISFEGALGGKRKMYFCRMFDRETDRFSDIADPEANATY